MRNFEVINTETTFECNHKFYHFNVAILVDTTVDMLKFQFKVIREDSDILPVLAQAFDVITTFDKKVLFNRLAESGNDVQERLKSCVAEFVRSFQHPGLPVV